MAKLQKANLGVPPVGSGGDDQRTANARFNANVDVLNSVVPVEYTYLADSTTLQPFHVGSRFGLSMPAAGKTVTLPLVSSVPVNACVHFFNVGPQVTIGTQGNDGTQIRTLNTGDWVAYIADGGSFWHVAERGRMFPDEIVGGRLTVGGEVIANAQNAFRAAQAEYGVILRNDGQNVYLLQTKKGDSLGGWNDYRPFSWGLADGFVKIDMTGAGCAIGSRPTWLNGLVPWDNGNFNPSGKLNVTGRTDGVAPAAGNVGEIISTSNSTVSLPGNRTPVGTTTLNLAPGEWDVQGSMIFNYNASGVVLNMAFVGVASSSGSLVAGQFAGIDGLSTQGWVTFVTPMVRFRFGSATTIWLNAQAAANANVPGFAQLTARRVAA